MHSSFLSLFSRTENGEVKTTLLCIQQSQIVLCDVAVIKVHWKITKNMFYTDFAFAFLLNVILQYVRNDQQLQLENV